MQGSGQQALHCTVKLEQRHRALLDVMQRPFAAGRRVVEQDI
jgi:hypothetical protein